MVTIVKNTEWWGEMSGKVKTGGGKAEKNAFRKLLLREAAEEDLQGLTPSDLEFLTKRAKDFVGTKKPGEIKIRLENTSHTDGEFSARSVLEILNDDMPFLVDSVVNALSRLGHSVYTILHPVLSVERDNKGKLKQILKPGDSSPETTRESYIHIHVGRLSELADRQALIDELSEILQEVRSAVVDWQQMRLELQKRIEVFRTERSPLPTAIVSETIDFLNWLLNNKFTFLGMSHYRMVQKSGRKQMVADPNSALGILRLQKQQVIQNAAQRDLSHYRSGYAVLVEKSDIVSRVHRSAVMDYIGLYEFDAKGEIAGELRIVGLFASSAYTEAASSIPLLRRRIDAVMSICGLRPSGHSGKGLLNVLETMSRDDLFQIESEQLAPLAMGMWRLQERPRTRLFVRLDQFERYVIAFVFFPRDRFTSDLREKAGRILETRYKGKMLEFVPNFGEGTLVRVRFIISLGVAANKMPKPVDVENEIVAATRGWDDELHDLLLSESGRDDGLTVAARYLDAFPPAYRQTNSVEEALLDIQEISDLSGPSSTAVAFLAPLADHGAARVKLYHPVSSVPLSARLPILEAMGLRALDENTYVVRLKQPTGEASDDDTVYIHEVALDINEANSVGPDDYSRLEDCFLAVWNSKADSDRLNSLVLVASLTWQEVAALRGLARYLRQTGFPYLLSTIAGALVRYPETARLLIDLFRVRFDPHHAKAKTMAARDRAQAGLSQKLEDQLANVPNLEDDRIIRYMAGAIVATIRTNFFVLGNQRGEIPTALAFKIRSKNVPGIPQPVPFAEIFVHSTLVEGVHLRAGKIARGGLRWSDRADDFRTEVLGLAKAQNVKNSVIVPVGAKGGFIPRQLPAGGTRDEVYKAGTLAYQSFVASLLSVTDNTSGDNIIPPEGIVRHDRDDPYLVVAADKGTAAFSDVANAISCAAGFWLDDAFASGGSAGYDHKKMGITARGGWEAVKRHFREMDRDIQASAFTAVGVGDMSGDVFGNGMLLSEQTRLIAAFDHRDIFIDPNPDAAKSFAERKRLFGLPRSSWQDYDSKLISKGGGVFSRSEKQISLSAEIMKVIGVSSARVTPNELMTAILKTDADLLWFGGIGTYVRASTETDADAGDKANDGIRVTAKQLKAKVIGEGANLGITQLGRVEFALAGGCINTDAIDNSAGVNSSDVEVNIKIALGDAEAASKLKRPARNKLLAAMTGEVASLVLRNNYLQTLCVSLSDRNLSREGAGLTRLFRELETNGGLDREIEFLPAHEVLVERLKAGAGFTRPEMAVLISYAKIVLFNKLLAQKTAGDPYFERELLRYFPQRMLKPYRTQISNHRLRAEIICTLLSNSIVNRCGPLFLFDLANDTSVPAGDLARFYALARDSFGFVDLNEAVDKLDNKLAGEQQLALYRRLQSALCDAVHWFADNEVTKTGLKSLVPIYSDGVSEIVSDLHDCLPAEQAIALKADAAQLTAIGLNGDAARRMAGLRHLVRGLDVVQIAKAANKPVKQTARTYFGLGGELAIDEVLTLSYGLSSETEYDRQAISGIRQTLQRSVRSIVTETVKSQLTEARRVEIEQAGSGIRRIVSEQEFSLAKLAVIASQLGALAKV
jgi:glutamate dehydrogenase